MSKKLLGLIAVASLYLVGCSDNTMEQSYSDAKGEGKVSLLMRDNVTGALLSNVSVTLIDNNKKVAADTTDSTGLAVFTGLTVGDKLFQVELAGHAGKIITVSLSDGSSDVPRVMDVAEEVRLPLLGAQVTGKVYYEDKYGNLNVLSGAAVDLYLEAQAPGTWVNGHLSATTGDDGAYTFDSLPEDVKLNVYVRSTTVAGEVYAAATSRTINMLKSGESRTLDKITLNVDGDALILLSDNLDSVSESGVLELIFSTEIDTSLIKLDDIKVTHGADKIASTSAWSDGNHKLTVKSSTGKWYVGSQDLVLNLQDINGASYAKSLPFSPESKSVAPSNATNLKIKANVYGKDTNRVNSNTASVTLNWTASANAEGYDILVKSEKDSNYVFTANVGSGTDSSYALNTTSFFDSAAVVKIMVLAYNSKSYADISKAPVITVKDSIRPRLVSTPGEFAVMSGLTDLELTSASDTIYADSVTFTFTEVMDTTKTPDLSFANNTGSTVVAEDLLLYWHWVSETEGHVVIGALPKKTVAPIDGAVSVDLSALTDVIGNFVQVPQSDWTKILVDNIP